MCILFYYICSKCYCGYPRFTECCPSMHPPLIYCPRSTQFKFRIVEEKECHLYPHHGPLMHLGDDGRDNGLSSHPSGSRPVIETVSQIPFMPANANSRLEETCNASAIESTRYPTPSQASSKERSYVARDQRPDHRGNYPTAEVTHSYTNPAAHTSWAQGSSSTTGYNRLHGRATKSSNWRVKGKMESDNTTKQYTPQSHSRATFDSQYRAQSHPNYQYYPYQVAPIPPFNGGSGSTPPGCAYMPVHSPNQPYEYQGNIPSASFQTRSHQTFPGRSFSDNGTCVSQPNRDTNQKSFFNPKATAFETQMSDELRKQTREQNLEQLQKSNDAAYYNLNCYVDTNTGTGSAPAYNPQFGTLSSSNEISRKPRSCSESYPRREYVSEVNSPTQEIQNLSHHGHTELLAIGKGAEAIQTSPSPSSSARPSSSTGSKGKNRDINQHKDSLEADQNSTKFDSTENGAIAYEGGLKNESTDGDNVSVKTECSISIKQESDSEDCKVGDISIKTDPEDEVKLHDITPAPSTMAPIKTSWSAVVSGRYVPSDSSNPFPALVPTPAPSTRTTAPVNTKALRWEKSAPKPDDTSKSSMTATPASHERLANVSSNSSRDEAPAKTWAGALQNESNTPSSRQLEKSLLTNPNESNHRGSSPCSLANYSTISGITSEASVDATKAIVPSTFDGAGPSQLPRPPVNTNRTTSPVATTLPKQRIAQIPQTTPTTSAPTPSASGFQPQPHPRLWSQVLGGSTTQPANLKTKSDGCKDEKNWPTLGSGGPKNERKRNTSS
ncbi:hypothetical protein GGS24DRAFT_513540 [Hypoxylon argillaceum]|nr:hypothetical protein GGS24DRAFT_513540 [Hypoxylon argillaceum]